MDSKLIPSGLTSRPILSSTKLLESQSPTLSKRTPNHFSNLSFKPSIDEKLDEISETSFYLQKGEDSREVAELQREFLSNLMITITGAIWTNIPIQGLWIDQISLTAPKSEWEKSNLILNPIEKVDNLKISEIEASDSETSTKTVELITSAAPFLDLRHLLSESSWDPQSEVRQNLSFMSGLVHFFVSPTWDFREETAKSNEKWPEYQLNREKFVLSNMQLRTFSADGSGSTGSTGEKVKTVLRLVRIYGGRKYYCDIFFNGIRGQNMIRVNYVKDNGSGSVVKYHANGSQGNYGEHIGGQLNFANNWGREYNSMDQEFSQLFENIEGRSKKVWKWFEVISRCIQSQECRALFHDQSHSNWTWWGLKSCGRAKNFGGVHPFTKIYQEVTREAKDKNFDAFTINPF
ncbi:hypothetical protein [Candidatus Mycoplasma haematominutum]|uniref:Uncharacterized protein n=1 Tax=Candidatus Mycoplasma haematominutum 'Birmingham 1' TaxID=1116213 RepID=G8C2P5_9MOLU|nr:hypothetical protein [Candidatus Mycoplasma haematominutum]CCE66593.1 hypothetical protein MHM_00750 [Candidatus Mycoplasma haematominutum 'Birmingham 1']